YNFGVLSKALNFQGAGFQGLFRSALDFSGDREPYAPRDLFRAAASSPSLRSWKRGRAMNLPGILGRAAQKIAVDAFKNAEVIYPLIARQSVSPDLTGHAAYVLDATGRAMR